MDPNQFRLDWEMMGEILAVIVFLSFAVERALAPVFEHRRYIARFKDAGLKEPIAFLVALLVCGYFQFDAMGVILRADQTSWVGYIVTAAIVAGGSKASIKLFHDLLGVKSTVMKEREADQAAAQAKPGAASGGAGQ